LGLRSTWEKVLREPSVRTIGVDTGTEVWELIRLHHFGKLAGNLPRYYEEPNKDFDRLIQLAYGSDKNVIITSETKDEYIIGKEKDKELRTGKQIYAGYKGVPYLVQVDLRLGFENGVFSATFTKCRQNPDMVGLTVEGDDVNFSMIATMVFPDTELSDWQ
jgi:hypothetical protein